MSRTNTEKIKFRKLELIHKHGARCMNNGCKRDFSNLPEPMQLKKLQLHHNDGNESNHKLTNLKKLFCASCHKKKHPNHLISALRNKQSTLKEKYIYRNKIRLADSYKYDSYSMYKHVKGYKPFFTWLDQKLKAGIFMTPEYIYTNGASMRVGGVLESTIKKWLRPELSDEGKYTIINILGTEYVVFKKDLPKLKKQKEQRENLQEKYGD